MRMKIWKMLIPIAALMSLMVSTASADAVVTVVPGLIGPTGSFTASVDITGVSNLAAFQFDLIYSPRIIQATSAVEGSFLAQGGSTFFIPGTIDNSAGSISFISGALTGASGVSGSGDLADVMFHAAGSGTSQITLANIQLYDQNLNPIIVADTPEQLSASVTVAPEPVSSLLMFSGIAVFAARFRRRRAQPRQSALPTHP